MRRAAAVALLLAVVVAAWGGNSRDAEKHWAFQPITRPRPPEVKNRNWPKTEIDRFILSRLEQEGATPAPAADPRTLIRRMSFDLIGLAPSAEEVDQFSAACKRNRER